MVRIKNFLLPFVLMVANAVVGCSNYGASNQSSDEENISKLVEDLNGTSSQSVKLPTASAGMLDFLEYAVAISPEIATLRAEEVRAKSGIDLAVSANRPQVNASSSVGGYKADISSGAFERGASVSLNVSQLLFDGGGAESELSAAELRLALAETSTQVAINRLSTEAAVAGVSLLLAEEELLVVQEFQAEIKPYAAQLRRMSQSGLIDRSMLDEINGRLLEIDIAVQEAKSAFNVAEMEYSKYFGDLSASTQNFVLPDRFEKIALSDTSFLNAPAVRESALRVILAEKQLAIARSAFYPKVTAEAGSASPMDPNESLSAQAGVRLTYQLGDGGARAANLSMAKADKEKAKRAAELIVGDTKKTLRALSARIDNIAEVHRLSEKKLPILVDQLKVAESQIQTGQANIQKVFEAKLKVNDLERRIRRSRVELVKAKLDMAAALGLFSI